MLVETVRLGYPGDAAHQQVLEEPVHRGRPGTSVTEDRVTVPQHTAHVAAE